LTAFGKNKRGVTLLELLIVLSIMTLIISLPLVSFGRFAGNTKLKMAARNVSSVLKLAKSYSVAANANHSFNTNLTEFWIKNEVTTKTVDDIYTLPETITFASPVSITFRPSPGQPTIVNSINIILVGPRGDTKTLKVSDTAGKVVIE